MGSEKLLNLNLINAQKLLTRVIWRGILVSDY